MASPKQNSKEFRLLVAIASYGEKNLTFLRRIIDSYRRMSMDVDIVIFSNATKNLGAAVKVIVGLPSANPWSLPFAHKQVFAENVDAYDLFIYSEDDIGVTEDNIRAFIRSSKVLKPDEIAGFLRYEQSHDGIRILTDMHESFHWKPDSVRARGDYTIAEFTNEHAGFYILTQSQLKKAIHSGGFLQSPYEGRYGLPETAATDPYTRCGFKKVICISDVDNFLVHHLSNRYADLVGIPFLLFKDQLQSLYAIGSGVHPVSKLCDVDSKMLHLRWSKSYYEKFCKELIKLAPKHSSSVLSIGCGWGATESMLQKAGASVTAIPLDSVIGATAAREGIDVIYGTLDEGLEKLGERKFDCIIISNLLHLQTDPQRMLERCSRYVKEGGILLINSPNFSRLPVVIKRAFGSRNYHKLRSFDESGIKVCAPGMIKKDILKLGFRQVVVCWHNHTPFRCGWLKIKGQFGMLTAGDWIMQARKMSNV